MWTLRPRREGQNEREHRPVLARRSRRLGVTAIAALLFVGAGSIVTRAALRLFRERRDQDRLRHARGQPTERPPEPPHDEAQGSGQA